jgi:uncharacterized protein (TIGR02246 family)
MLALPAALFLLAAGRVVAEDAKGDAKDKTAIAKNGEAFVEAFQKADAKALAAFWAPEGDYTGLAGKHMKGREAIEEAFTGYFKANKGLKARIHSISLSFLTPDVAVEDGVSEVMTPDGVPPSRAHYTIVHVKKDGRWFLGSVRESPYSPPSNYEHLRGLEWAIGDWAGEGDNGATERLTVSWAEDQNFIHATFATAVKNVRVGSAHQWIGWDPIGKNIRSWIFDVTGGFGEGSWSSDGKKWTVKTASVLADGKKATATYVLTAVDADTLTLQARDRTEDGAKVPDSKEIKMSRAK